MQLPEMLTIQREIDRLVDTQLNDLKSQETHVAELITKALSFLQSLREAQDNLKNSLKTECGQTAHCMELIVGYIYRLIPLLKYRLLLRLWMSRYHQVELDPLMSSRSRFLPW